MSATAVRILRASFVVLVLGLLGPLGIGADRREEIVARGVLRVGTTGDYPPFSYRANARSPFMGLDVELAARLAQMLGVKLELVATSWPTLMQDFAAGHFDVAMSGVSITAEREQRAFFSVPYLRDGKTPIARCENQARFQTLEQIDQPGVRVVVNPGGTNERFARAHLRRATLTVWPDNTTIFDRILAGEADLMITDAIETRLQQRLRPQLCAVHPEAPFDTSLKAYLLSRDVRLKAAVDAWLEPIVSGGELSRRLEAWLDHPWPRAAPGAISLSGLGRLITARLALMPDVAHHKWRTKTAIEDLGREQQVLDGLGRDAAGLGVPAAWAERFFRSQIEAAKVVQRDHFNRWQRGEGNPDGGAPDLVTVTRPRLDALTGELLRELARSWPALSDPAQQVRLVAELQGLLPEPATGAEALAVALRPLTDRSATAATP